MWFIVILCVPRQREISRNSCLETSPLVSHNEAERVHVQTNLPWGSPEFQSATETWKTAWHIFYNYSIRQKELIPMCLKLLVFQTAVGTHRIKQRWRQKSLVISCGSALCMAGHQWPEQTALVYRRILHSDIGNIPSRHAYSTPLINLTVNTRAVPLPS